MQRINHTAPLPKAKRTTRRQTTPRSVTRREPTYREYHVIVPPPSTRVPTFQWYSFIGQAIRGIIYTLTAMVVYLQWVHPSIPAPYEYQTNVILLSILFFIFIFNPLSKRISEHNANVADVERTNSNQTYSAVLAAGSNRRGQNDIVNLLIQSRHSADRLLQSRQRRSASPPAPPRPPRPRNVMDM